MARPERPVEHTVPALGVLAEYLRHLRRTAGLTYEELAVRSGYSTAHLKRAASGRTLPDLRVVLAYAKGCRSAEEEWATVRFRGRLAHWLASDAVAQAERTARRSAALPKPQHVRDLADLSGALRDAWARAGRPSARAIEAASGGKVSRSTTHAIAAGRTVPRDFRQYVAFLGACDPDDQPLGPWFCAWFKVFGSPSVDTAARALDFLGIDPRIRRAYLDAYLAETTLEERNEKLAQLALRVQVGEHPLAGMLSDWDELPGIRCFLPSYRTKDSERPYLPLFELQTIVPTQMVDEQIDVQAVGVMLVLGAFRPPAIGVVTLLGV